MNEYIRSFLINVLISLYWRRRMVLTKNDVHNKVSHVDDSLDPLPAKPLPCLPIFAWIIKVSPTVRQETCPCSSACKSLPAYEFLWLGPGGMGVSVGSGMGKVGALLSRCLGGRACSKCRETLTALTRGGCYWVLCKEWTRGAHRGRSHCPLAAELANDGSQWQLYSRLHAPKNLMTWCLWRNLSLQSKNPHGGVGIRACRTSVWLRQCG